MKASPEIASVVTAAVGVSLLVVSFLLGRRGQDKAAFTLGIVAVLAFAPIVWLHYLTILLVPLAIYRPRLSAAWALPIACWAIVFPGTPSELTKLVASAVVALLVASLLAPKRLTIVRERLTRRRRSSGLRERAT